MNDYEKQAQDFLESTGTTFTIEFLYTGHYFLNDKEKRDVYQFTLKNARGEYTAKFGDSIRNTERRAFAKSLSGWSPGFNVLDAKKLGFKVTKQDTISRDEIRAAAQHKPSAYDILACLTKYDPGTFKDFCDDFGYSDQPLTEYTKVQGIYQAVLDEYHAVRRLFTAEQREQLAEINQRSKNS